MYFKRKPTRRYYTHVFTTLLLLCSPLTTVLTHAAEQPNIIVIMADDKEHPT